MTPVPPLRQRARRGQLVCLVCLCVLSLITAGLKRTGGVAAFIPSSRYPPSRPVAFAPHLTTSQRPRSAQPPQPLPSSTLSSVAFTRSHPSHHLHPDTLHPPPDIPPAASPLSTCCPGDSIAAETTLQPCTVAVHMCVNVCRCGRGQSRS